MDKFEIIKHAFNQEPTDRTRYSTARATSVHDVTRVRASWGILVDHARATSATENEH